MYSEFIKLKIVLSIISLSNTFKNKWLIESTPMGNIFYQNNFHWPQR